MDERDVGFDPAVKQYFRKIINTVSFGMMWLMATCTAGFYFKLAKVQGGHWETKNTVFYVLALLSFVFLLRYFLRLWRGLK